MKRNLLCLVLAWLFLGVVCPHNMRAQSNQDYYEAFLEVNGSLSEFSLYQLRQAGVLITGRYDGFMTVRIKNDVDPFSLLDIEGIEYVTKALTLLTSGHY